MWKNRVNVQVSFKFMHSFFFFFAICISHKLTEDRLYFIVNFEGAYLIGEPYEIANISLTKIAAS